MQEIEFMNYLKGNIWESPSFGMTLNVDIDIPTRNHFSGVAHDLKNTKNANLEVMSKNCDGDLCFNRLSDVGNSKKNIKGSKKSVGRAKTQQHKYIQRGSLFLLEQGVILNQLLLHKEAIEKLSKAILVDPNNQEAYLERAIAYFETNQLDLALKDYKKVKKLDITPPFKSATRKINLRSLYLPENKIEFSKGFLKGCLRGSNLSLTELLPSLFSSCRGILNGLWAFTCSPIEVSRDMINTAYEIGDFISKNSTLECLQCVVPELKEVSLFWNEWNDKKKGKKIGFIIGKYGTDIFAPIVAIKGISKLQAIRRANTMLTLDCCLSSETKKAIILKESAKRANARTGILQTTKKGKIFVKSSNVKYHVMQEKHAWGKVIQLSGNVEEDFAKVIAFIEENEITSKACLKGEPLLYPANQPKIQKLRYEKTINNLEIQVILEIYLETGEMFLQNAWVVTK